jgi:hypothetical protein
MIQLTCIRYYKLLNNAVLSFLSTGSIAGPAFKAS